MLKKNDVHVWFVLADHVRPWIGELQASLDTAERKRASRFVFARDREQFIIARGALRYLLAAYLSEPAQGLQFRVGTHGKPALVDQAVSFNLSHSGSLTALAVAPGNIQVGIDVELVRTVPGMHELVQYFFAETEYDAWLATTRSEREDLFFRLWTRKEAIMKATGAGFSQSLHGVTVNTGDQASILFPIEGHWSLHHLVPSFGYVGALAVSRPAPRLQMHSLRRL